MRKTQKEQLENATTIYLHRLTPRMNINQRYAVYHNGGNSELGLLDVLWPSDTHKAGKSQELLPLQVFSERREYVAYHFTNTGDVNEIAAILREVNPYLRVYLMDGATPTFIGDILNLNKQAA